MQNSAYDHIDIQRYLDGDMTDQEREAFEHILETDDDLQEEVKEFTDIIEGINYSRKSSAWQKIQELEKEADIKENIPDNSRSKQRWIWYSGIAASIAIIIAAIVFFSRGDGNEELFAEYFEPYPALAYAPDRSDTISQGLKEEAFAAYSNGYYDESIQLFNQILGKEENPYLLFYLSNAYLHTKQPKKAISVLKQALNYDVPIATQIRWYLALSYILDSDREAATEILIKISKGDSAYKERANNILQKL